MSEENTSLADLGKGQSLALRYHCSYGATCGRLFERLIPLLLIWKTVIAGCGLGRKPVSPTVVSELEDV
jgi:hypothetical protein